MSDILLSVGLQKGSTETSQIQTDLQSIISQIDRNPPKVKVGLQVDQSAINHFKSQLTQIVNSVSLSNGAPITVNISGIGEITAQATQAKQALDGVTKAAQQASDATNNMSTTQTQRALTQINTQIKSIQTNHAKWTAAQNGQSSSSYETYGEQIKALETLKLQVESNTISFEDFTERLNTIKATASEAAASINKFGEDHTAKKVVTLGTNTEEYRKALSRANDELIKIKKNQDQWTAARTGKGASDYAALSQYEKQLESLIVDLSTGKMTMDEFNQRFSAIKANADASRSSIQGFGEDTKSLSDKIKGLAEKFSAWFSVTQVIMMAVRTVKKMVTAVREVDAAMTELKKVTNETDATYNRFLSTACERAKQLGAAVSDVVTATADFARLGYNVDDASTLADAAIVYKNIGDGIDDITTASESIISTMQAFGIEASDVMSIVDRFNEVGNNFAISSAGIGEAMQRSAAAMASANNTIDETIALITAANTVVQNPESVGTALKTVSMYLRAAKTEAEEAGESTDGMANSVSELRQDILDLTGQKVDIQIDDDTFKSTYQILKELSEVWDGLKDTSQANLLEMIGGKRNANVLSALLEDFSIAEDALQSSMDSAGSALEENEKHLDSINGKIEIFTASFQTLSTSLIDSELVKGIVDFGTSILDALTSVTELVGSMGGLTTVLLTVTSAFLMAKNGAVSFAAAKAIVTFFTKVKTGISNVINIIPSAVAAWKSYAAGTVSASVAMQASIPVIGLVLSAITVLVAGFSLYNDTIDESRQKTHENASAAAELSEEVGGLALEYTQLNAAVTEDESAKESLLDTQAQLIEALGLEQYEVDRLTEKYGNLSDAILQASKDALVNSEIDLRSDINAYADELRDAAGEVRTALYLGRANTDGDTQAWYKEIQDAAAAYEALQSAGYLNASTTLHGSSNATYGTYSNGTVTGVYNARLVFDWDLNTIDGIISAYNELGDMLTLVGDTAGSNNYLYDGLYEQYLLLRDAVENYNDSIGALNSNLAQQYVLEGLIGKEVPATQSEFDSYRQTVIDAAVASGEFIGSEEQIISAIDGVLKHESQFADFYNTVSDTLSDTAQKQNDTIARLITGVFKDVERVRKANPFNFDAIDDALDDVPDKISEIEDAISGLTDEQLEFVFDLVVNQGVDDLDEVNARLDAYNWDKYSSQLSVILEAGGLSDISSEITTLSEALSALSDGTIGVEDVVSLIQQFPELAKYVDFTADNFGNLEDGLRALIKNSPDDFIKTLQEFKETNKLTGDAAEQIDALCDAVGNLPVDALRDISGEFGVLAESINAATKAQNELEEALAEDDYDAGYESRVDAFEGFQEVIGAGEFGSKAYAAYKEYFGLAGKTHDEVEAWMADNEKYFTEGTDGLVAFMEKVEALSESGELDGIASFDSESGEFWYDINELSAFADALGWTETMLQDFIYKYRMYCEEWASRSAQDNLTEFTKAGIVFDVGDETFASLQTLMDYTHLSKDEVESLVGAMNEFREQQGLEPVQLIGSDQIVITQAAVDNLLAAGASAEDVIALLTELNGNNGVTIEAGIQLDGQNIEELIAEVSGDGSETVSIDVSMTVDDEGVTSVVTTTVEQVQAILGDQWEIVLSADSSTAEERIDAVKTLLSELPSETLITVNDVTSGVRSNLNSVINYLSAIEKNKNKVVTVTYRSVGSLPANATGTRHAVSGPSLLGDEYSPDGSPKPELVVSNGRAYIAGQNGPEIGYLNEGDIVYTADETKQILRGNVLHNSIPAHAGGTTDWAGLSSGKYNTSNTGSDSSSSSNSSSSSDDESWFERQYKDHNHWLEMDKESVSDYLEWLDDAYKQAYEEGIIDLDDYYKYEEEVYQKTEDLFKDYLNDIDHEISMLEAGVGNSDEIINLSLQAIQKIEKELAAARAAGLDENGDYIQYLEQQWLNYYQTVTDLREDAESSAQNSIDELVEYRIKMLKQDIENQKDALNEKLDDLQDFYDKQREMLQDQYDEEKYLEEQSEKRKSVTDIQSELAMLEHDDSAWAQKRKLELKAELADAQKELDDFEKDYALDAAIDMLDEQQAAQEALIQAEIDALDEKLNDPHALFNQALEDIKNNTAELYQEFIEYNRKYGTGNDADIADIWEEAYKADLEYQDTHDGEHLDGIAIGNYTGYVVPTTPQPSQPGTEAEPTSSSEPETTTASNTPEVTDEIKKKVAAAIWNGGYGWGNGADRINRLTEVFGANNGIQDLVNKGVGKSGVSLTSEYTYANMRKKFKGYASGTDNATPGWHRLFEGDLDEYVFASSDGNKYRMFSGLGEKVLNGAATDFLYDFANSGGTVLTKMLADLFGQTAFSNIDKPVQAIEIHSGDIIVQGNASERTVSEIRRAQRDNLKFVITEFNKLNK